MAWGEGAGGRGRHNGEAGLASCGGLALRCEARRPQGSLAGGVGGACASVCVCGVVCTVQVGKDELVATLRLHLEVRGVTN